MTSDQVQILKVRAMSKEEMQRWCGESHEFYRDTHCPSCSRGQEQANSLTGFQESRP